MFKKLQLLGQAIKAVKANVPTTKLEKAKSKLAIAKQKMKASAAKLKQTQFELKNKKPLTFKTKTGKSESNKEAYKRIQGENTKVLKSMIDKATNKKDGGRIGRKFGSPKPKTNVEKIKKAFAVKGKNLKPVDKKKNPGLAKLPTKVRNKMGFKSKGGKV